LCYTLGDLTDDDKWIGRLWATFATPKRSGRWLREHTSTFPLQGVQCRGVELYAGGTRGTRATLLVEAQRADSGQLPVGGREFLHAYCCARTRGWERRTRAGERARSSSSRPTSASASCATSVGWRARMAAPTRAPAARARGCPAERRSSRAPSAPARRTAA